MKRSECLACGAHTFGRSCGNCSSTDLRAVAGPELVSALDVDVVAAPRSRRFRRKAADLTRELADVSLGGA